MKRKDWINLGFFSLFVGLYSPTIQVLVEAPMSEWRVATYEITFLSQMTTWIVVSAMFLLCVEIGSRLVPLLDSIVANFLTWIVGGIIMVVTQMEMFWLTLRAFNQEFSQKAVFDALLTQESLLNSLGLGLVVMVFSICYRSKRIKDGNCLWIGKTDIPPKNNPLNSTKEEELSQLIELVSDTPPIRI